MISTVLRQAAARRGCPAGRRAPTPATLLVLTRFYSQAHSTAHNAQLQNTRNIGIIAHVDAGKTTTTERMLYYSGMTNRVGDVDAGNTVTDFLELERERGITIQSAAITFPWPRPEDCAPGTQPKTVNLIDTPGHQDFRFEVDRCLPILDGAVCIIDSVKGVEAHTERVWASAHEFRIPRIVYCNKLDREGASFRKAVLEVGTRLRGWPLVCQIPWWDKDEFVGVIDVIDRVGYRWKSDRDKVRVEGEALREALPPQLAREVDVARQRLVEGLADFDEAVMDEFLAERADDMASSLIKQAIRRCIRSGDGRVIPVFAGSSFRHIGVEALMDAVAEYLPSPDERPDVEVRAGGGGTRHKLGEYVEERDKKGNKALVSAVASVFKVYNHPREGVISFVRVYRGTLTRNASTFNTHIHAHERPMGILQISADRTHDVQELSVGQIGALRGLRQSRTGDTLVTTVGNKTVPDAFRHMQVRPPDIPPPVAFLQVDPFGNVAAQELQTALENASREDPSLRWSRNPKTDQFTVQGMGKLHLDVSLHNLRRRGKIDAEFGPIEVDYKECLTAPPDPQHAVFDRPVASRPGKAACTVALEPIDPDEHQSLLASPDVVERDGNLFIIDLGLADEATASFDADEARHQLLNGAIAGLARGPRRAAPLHGCRVTVSLDTSEGMLDSPTGGHLSSAARLGVQAGLRQAFERGHVGVLEPVMLTHITCPEAVAGTVQHDITAGAGGAVLEVNDRSGETAQAATEDGEVLLIDAASIYAPPDPYDSATSLRGKKSSVRTVEIVAKVPYKEMLGYDEHLRGKTAGRHSLTMAFDSFARVVGHREKGL